MRVTIECYGIFRSLCGGDEYPIEVAGDDVTVAAVLDALAAEVPGTADHLPRTACALGDRLVERDETIADGARVALIPPVSGG